VQEYNDVSDAGAIELAEGLSSNRSLQYLFLVRHTLLPHAHVVTTGTLLHSPQLCVAIAPATQSLTPTVQRRNRISPSGICRIVSALVRNTSLLNIFADHSASSCICHGDWQRSGLPVVPEAIALEDWAAVIVFVRSKMQRKE
jgi:hypothetical protein